MFSIDLTIKNTAFPVSVQRKEAEDAQALYQQILEAMQSHNPSVLELTCEKQPEKKVAVVTEQVSAVIMSQKSGATASGRAPGFFSAGAAQ